MKTLAASAVFVTTLGGLTMTGVVPAGAATTTGNSQGAAAWLADQFHNGHLSSNDSDQNAADWGLTLDGILALTASKADQKVAATATDAVAVHVNDYITGTEVTADQAGHLGAGQIAKVMLAAQGQGRSVTDFGGVNLSEQLDSLRVTADGAQQGRYRDTLAVGDYTGALTQSLAVLATTRAGTVSPDSVTWLVNAQCGDGGFSYGVSEDTGAGCADPWDSSQVDVTAVAVQALASSAVSDVPGVTEALAKATSYLANAQHADGSFSDGGTDDTSYFGPNANSTGLAAAALRLVGQLARADQAANWLGAHQLTCVNAATGKAASNRGALLFNDAAQTSALAGELPLSQTIRATSQGILGLAGVSSFATASSAGAQADTPRLTCAAPKVVTVPKAVRITQYTVNAQATSSTVRFSPVSTGNAGATSYRVRVATVGKSWGAWKSLSAKTTSFTVSLPKAGRAVQFVAVNSAGTSSTAVVQIKAKRTGKASSCAAIGATTIKRAGTGYSVSYAKRSRSCASYRKATTGKWHTVRKGSSKLSVSAGNHAVQLRSGHRVTTLWLRPFGG